MAHAARARQSSAATSLFDLLSTRPTPAWISPAATLGALLALALFARWCARALRRAAARARCAHAIAVEGRAASLLERRGYRVVGRQVEGSYLLDVDGAKAEVRVRADYVVEAGDRRYVAEVKSGRLAPRLDTAATRRQLLEYRVAFDVDGVLLVDGEAGRVHAVAFPMPVARAPSRAIPLAVGLAVGAAITAFVTRAGLLP